MAEARDAMRMMLQQLMGDTGEGEDSIAEFTDERLCASFLCGMCPHDMFGNTKVDELECPKKHSVTMKEKYTEAAKEKDHPEILQKHFERLKASVAECDRRCARGKSRLEEAATADPTCANKATEIAACLANIGQRLSQLDSSDKVEDGDPDKLTPEAHAILSAEIDALKRQREKLDGEFKQLLPQGSDGSEQKLQLCEMCGALLSIFDNDRRLTEHFGGKQHMGFVKIRAAVEDLRTNKMDVLRRRPSTSDHSRDRDRRDRSRERDRRSERSHNDGDHSRDRRDRPDDRSRGRSRDDRRDRTRDRRSRDRDDHRRSRDRDDHRRSRDQDDRDRRDRDRGRRSDRSESDRRDRDRRH